MCVCAPTKNLNYGSELHFLIKRVLHQVSGARELHRAPLQCCKKSSKLLSINFVLLSEVMQERKFAFLNPCAIILLNSRYCGVLGSFTETDELSKKICDGVFLYSEKNYSVWVNLDIEYMRGLV